MLKQIEKENILSDFPNIKLSYENITYKKVYNSDYLVAIPEGKKCFAWFTTLNEKNVCFIMKLTINKQITDIKIVNACFSNEIVFGTIIYGTTVYHSNNRFFYIEDIFSYRGVIIERECWGEKLIKINKMLKYDLKQIAYNNYFIIFGLPLICDNYHEFDNKIKNIPYKIDNIQFKLFDKVNSYLLMSYQNYINDNEKNNLINNDSELINTELINKETNKKEYNNSFKNKECIFLIRPDIQVDVYFLYCLNALSEEEYHSIAHIPDYNTSVLMNKLFRNIKENDNLDALEESDDEEEFENENLNKFVYLDKCFKMICKFNHKFKKWVPIKLAEENTKVITTNELKVIYNSHEKNHNNYNKNHNNYNKNHNNKKNTFQGYMKNKLQ